MADAPKNPNVERLAGMPFEKDAVSPLPQFAARSHEEGSAAKGGSDEPRAAAERPAPDKEEYPGPQTATSGERAEPGRRPSSDDAGPES
jgi:hypothetical protein